MDWRLPLEVLGSAEAPVVEQLVAYHFHPNLCSILGKTEHFTASMYQNVYKAAAQSKQNFNKVTLVSAYYTDLFQDTCHLFPL